MKNVQICAMLALAIALPPRYLVAQPPAGPGAGASKQEVLAKLEKISTALQLTPRQKMHLLPILKEEAPQLKAVKENASLGPLQKAMQLKQISTAIDTKVTPILNPMQQEKWQLMREEERKQMLQKLENR